MTPSYDTSAKEQDPKSVPVDDIMKAIDGVDFPADKKELKKRAKKNDAPEIVRKAIEKLPRDDFEGAPDIMKAYEEWQEE